jgi:hypothetical protein
MPGSLVEVLNQSRLSRTAVARTFCSRAGGLTEASKMRARNASLLLAILAMVVLGGAPGAVLADSEPLHNSLIPTDVDGNHLVQPRDAELIIALLLPHVTAATMATLSESQAGFFYDTTNDRFVSPRDAVLVINHLLLAPEPSSLVLAGLGLVALFGYARRRRATRR